MNFRTWIPYAVGSVMAIALTACSDSPTSPAVTSAEARTDLQVVAAKVKYLSTPNPSDEAAAGGAAKKGAGKRSAALCDQEAVTHSYDTDTNDYGVEEEYWDTTTSYTASGALICAEGDVTSYDFANSYSKDIIAESWFKSRTDYPPFEQMVAGTGTGTIKIAGSGKVHYFSGYTLQVQTMNIKIDLAKGTADFSMSLLLENGYTVPMTVAAGVDMMSEEPLPPTTVVMSGPIQKGGTTVGYFEVLANDGVVIKDASKVVIESHG
jgi:hypothetical protein